MLSESYGAWSVWETEFAYVIIPHVGIAFRPVEICSYCHGTGIEPKKFKRIYPIGTLVPIKKNAKNAK